MHKVLQFLIDVFLLCGCVQGGAAWEALCGSAWAVSVTGGWTAGNRLETHREAWTKSPLRLFTAAGLRKAFRVTAFADFFLLLHFSPILPSRNGLLLIQ